jgi:hypothetical protein
MFVLAKPQDKMSETINLIWQSIKWTPLVFFAFDTLSSHNHRAE